MRLRVLPTDEVGMCKSCTHGMVMRTEARTIVYCNWVSSSFPLGGKVLECSRYSPIGARRLDHPDVPEMEPEEIHGRGWWESNTYL